MVVTQERHASEHATFAVSEPDAHAMTAAQREASRDARAAGGAPAAAAESDAAALTKQASFKGVTDAEEALRIGNDVLLGGEVIVDDSSKAAKLAKMPTGLANRLSVKGGGKGDGGDSGGGGFFSMLWGGPAAATESGASGNGRADASSNAAAEASAGDGSSAHDAAPHESSGDAPPEATSEAKKGDDPTGDAKEAPSAETELTA